MLDWVPTQFWLLLSLALICWAPVVVIRKRLTMSELDSERPGSRDFAISVAVISVALSTAVFIFTPQAKAFAHSPQFVPVLLAGLAALSIYSTAQGFVAGSVEPLIRGSLGPYSREEQPKRYWASQIWNVGISLILVWGATTMEVTSQ